MAARLRFSPAARDDLEEIRDYIASDDLNRALDFVRRLRSTCSKLVATPGLGRARPDLGQDLRSFPHGSYVIFYRPMPDEVRIVRILHGARDVRRLF